jgi:hypothetical protein
MKNTMNKTGKHKTQSQAGGENVSYNLNKHRPEIRNDLDSREMEEQYYRGDDGTHNQKPRRSRKHTTKD